MPAKREDVARAAIQLERDGRMFYLDVAANTRTPLTRKMYESLADDELDHIEWIENMIPGIDAAATANRELYERLRPIFAAIPKDTVRKIADSKSDVDAINLAIDVENKSVAAYENWANDAADPEVRELCSILVGVETFHRLVLTNTLEYFENTPDWFMEQEHWNFEGA